MRKKSLFRPLFFSHFFLAVGILATTTLVHFPLSDSLLINILFASVILVISILLSWRVALFFSRPLQKLNASARLFSDSHLQHRIAKCGILEIDQLAETLNHLAALLDERIRTSQHQQNELDAILESLDEGVMAVQSEGIILNVNQCFCTLMGIDDTIRGKKIHEVIRKADLLDFLNAALSSPLPRETTLQFRGESNAVLQVRSTALKSAPEEKIGALIVLRDTTRLTHLERIRRDFVANVSHELRTPITSIRGFVETLLEGEENHEQSRPFLEIILRQAKRLQSIIEDLLILSRIESGPQPIELTLSPLKPVLQSALETCLKAARDRNIHLRCECPEELRGELLFNLLEQAIVNLLDNAIKHSPDNSEVVLQAREEEGFLLISVIDHGCGIDPLHLPRLFERFYRVDKARSREKGGTGLGLSIVKHITLLHHGSVEVQSRLGEGSTFTIQLPLPSSEKSASGS